VLLAVAGPAGADPPDSSWPPFLPPPGHFTALVAGAVERIWEDPTLSRTVRGRPAQVPFDVYVSFVDAPDVTAAAASHLGLARYEVDAIDADWYRADDHDGSRGIYRVLVRDPTRRVILSWGEHSGSLLGTIRGSALTVLDFTPSPDGVQQSLTAHVRIDNAVLAGLARVLVRVFGGVADRKLAEGFTVTARVAEWAVQDPAAFCAWLGREGPPGGRQERVRAVLPACDGGPTQRATS
jgi:hypothetical protein